MLRLRKMWLNINGADRMLNNYIKGYMLIRKEKEK